MLWLAQGTSELAWAKFALALYARWRALGWRNARAHVRNLANAWGDVLRRRQLAAASLQNGELQLQ